VAAPLPPDVTAAALTGVQAALVAHCRKMEDRVAILDSVADVAGDNLVISTDDTGIHRPAADPKGYGAFYFPWIEVADPLGDPGARHPPTGALHGPRFCPQRAARRVRAVRLDGPARAARARRAARVLIPL